MNLQNMTTALQLFCFYYFPPGQSACESNKYYSNSSLITSLQYNRNKDTAISIVWHNAST